jgi:Family of unknown function (DUF6929)
MRRAEALPLRERGRLRLPPPGSQDGRLHIAAASGMVRRDEVVWVVADDEPTLGAFRVADTAPVDLVALAAEPLPAGVAERRALKPDLESLAGLADGSLLALGSGATPRRDRAWRWAPGGLPAELDLGDLYDALRAELDDLNIEGAALTGDRLWLAQRGNGALGHDALVELDADAGLRAEAIRSIRRVELGEVAGVPLTLSDLTPLPDGRLAFCAVAEDAASTYEDGPLAGAAVGVLDPATAAVARIAPLASAFKVEGITALPAGAGALDLLLVADGDDAAVAAPLLETRMPL